MGILAPIFLAALAGLSIPLVMHLVRRQPQGRQAFSSLMFLAPTPPRLTRRRQLDQILLLMLRLAALGLLAVAFSRPFLRELSLLSLADLPEKRVAILIDTSASMRRDDVWSQTLASAEKELDQLAPQDEVALFSFGKRLEVLIDWPADARTASASREAIRQKLRSLSPTWESADLGLALRSVAERMDSNTEPDRIRAARQILVFSDFQKGTHTAALQGYEWPALVQVIERRIRSSKTTNAAPQLLPVAAGSAEEAPRVLVTNAADSQGEQFFVRWALPAHQDSTSPGKTDETAVYVPPGQSRVVKLPRTEATLLADRIILRGDDHDFDNVYFVAPPQPRKIAVGYLGADTADDPQGLLYYFRLAAASDPLHAVTIQLLGEQAADQLRLPDAPRLVVVGEALTPERGAALAQFAGHGGTVLLVASTESVAATIPHLLDDVEVTGDKSASNESEFHLLGEINFAHPLFAPLEGPRYNDFTRIHFWKASAVALKPDAKSHVVARFDNQWPWLIERNSGRGRIFVMTSGWQPDDAQLALSTKFVPLMGSLLELAYGSTKPLAGVVVGESITLPEERRANLIVTTPDRRQVKVAAAEGTFGQTTAPGVYSAEGAVGEDAIRFAVNLAPAESDTAALPAEQLTQLGVREGPHVSRAEELAQKRQARDIELESRQQVWRWLIILGFVVMIVETWWSGRVSQVSRQNAETFA